MRKRECNTINKNYYAQGLRLVSDISADAAHVNIKCNISVINTQSTVTHIMLVLDIHNNYVFQ